MLKIRGGPSDLEACRTQKASDWLWLTRPGIPQTKPRGENQERRTWLTFGLQSCGESISIDRDCVSLMLSNLLCPSRRRVDSRAEGPLLDGLVTHGAAHRNARDAEASAVYPVVQPDQLAKLGARVQSCTAVPQATYMPAGSPRAEAQRYPLGKQPALFNHKPSLVPACKIALRCPKRHTCQQEAPS
jgi:hypothetical protein